MVLSTYSIQIPVFEGPLDLLLRLIEREELDITAISLVQVTDQYLTVIEGMNRRGIPDLTSFLVVAAKLVLIKSQALLPRSPSVGMAGEEEDVAADLLRQLEEYRRFKMVAQDLASREEKSLCSYLRINSLPELPPTFDLGDVTLAQLLTMARDVFEAAPGQPVDEVITEIPYTVPGQISRIKSRLSHGERTEFREVLSQGAGLMEVIVTLLALLELLKQDEVRVWQETLFGSIFIEAITQELLANVPETQSA